MKNAQPTFIARQGDVMFIARRKPLPSGLAQRAGGILAYGEVTGHSHRVADLDTAQVFECGDGLILTVSPDGIAIDGTSGASVIHEEHGTINLAPGNYDVIIQREYSPAAIRQVVD